MNLSLALLISSLLAQVSTGNFSEDDYHEVHHIPCYSGGAVHCEQEMIRGRDGKLHGGQYYAFKPHVAQMGSFYPHIRFSDERESGRTSDHETHFLDYDSRQNCYRFAANDRFKGKVAKWLERQDWNSKLVERELLIPGHSPDPKWKTHTQPPSKSVSPAVEPNATSATAVTAPRS